MSPEPTPPEHQPPSKSRTRVGVFVLAAVFALMAIGIIAGNDESEPRPGDPSVYAEIEAMTDCALLQEGFDRNDRMHEVQINRGNLELAQVVTSYMRTYDERMQAIDCY